MATAKTRGDDAYLLRTSVCDQPPNPKDAVRSDSSAWMRASARWTSGLVAASSDSSNGRQHELLHARPDRDLVLELQGERPRTRGIHTKASRVAHLSRTLRPRGRPRLAARMLATGASFTQQNGLSMMGVSGMYRWCTGRRARRLPGFATFWGASAGKPLARITTMSKSMLSTLAALALLSLAGCAAPSEDVDSEMNVGIATTLETSTTAATLEELKGLPLCDDETSPKTAAATAGERAKEFESAKGSATVVTCLPRIHTRRGVPLVCAPGLVPSEGMCRRPCDQGYTMIDGACWLDGCPKGFRDDGIFCAKPAPSPKCVAHAKGGDGCDVECPKGMVEVDDSCRKSGYAQNENNTKPLGFSPLPRPKTPLFTAPPSACPSDRPERIGHLCFATCLAGFRGWNDACVWAGR